MNSNLFLAVLGSYLMVAILGIVLGHLSAELQHRAAREIDSWPTLPDLDPWAEPVPPAYDWQTEESGVA
jgi:hypothetical protein